MKSRQSYFLISGIILLSIFLGFFIWRNKHHQEMPNLNKQSFTAPISSIYVPTNADIVFHWKINPTKLPMYIERYQDKVIKNITNKKIISTRDSFFKLVSLDFSKDISKWAGDNGSFAVFDTNSQLMNGWLMVLEINKEIDSEKDLESFLGPKLIDQNITSTNKLNIIKRKINSNKSIFFLKEKEHILISSNQKIIESSINKLNTNKLSIKDKYKNIKLKDNIKDGFLLLEMSPKKIFNKISQKESLLEIDQTDRLVSSINIDKNKFILEGILYYDVKDKRPINSISYDLMNTEEEFKLFNDYILIDNPKRYFGKSSIHPYKKLIASIIQKSTTTTTTTTKNHSKLFKRILENTTGNLIWLKDKEWLVLTGKSDTAKTKIGDTFEKDKFIKSSLDFNKKNLEVWSKITANNNSEYEIKEKVEAIIQENEDTYTWSQSLAAISDFNNKQYVPNNLDSEKKINEINDFDDAIRIHLGREKSKAFLDDFYPYILLRTMLGNKLNFPQNIDISIAVPTINYPDFVKFKINLKTS